MCWKVRFPLYYTIINSHMISGHATLALRQDYREHLTKVRKELGFQMVRFHGLLSDDMSVVLPGENNTVQYSFFNVDSVLDFLLSIDMKPLVELSFTPELLASGTETIFHYKSNITPPKNSQQWFDLIVNLMKHLIERYGINEIRSWHFEVYNEPNCGFWTGTQLDYFKFYNTTAQAIKSVDKQITVGGPATCQSAWLPEFVSWCKSNHVPLDFVTTHEYPTDVQPLQRDIMTKVLTKARSEVGDLPLFYTEYNAGLGDIRYQDSEYPAAFVVKNIADVGHLVQIFSFWTFTDIFEEGGLISKPYNGQFGMQNIYGVAKPVYRAFQLLHQSGNRRIQVQYPSETSTVDILSTYDEKKKQIMIFVSNYDILTNKPQSYDIVLNIQESDSIIIDGNSATLQRIDANNANSYAAWQQMGSPMYPTPAQITKLNTASLLVSEPIQVHSDQHSRSFIKLHVAECGLSVITIQCQ
jgi:xylan 1,4-beta-xylosidase